MSDDQTTIGALKDLVRAFSRERDWEQFHHPKDLGVALACEVGEVLEHFRYRTNDEIHAFLGTPDNRRELAHELADCLWLLLRLADVLHRHAGEQAGFSLIWSHVIAERVDRRR